MVWYVVLIVKVGFNTRTYEIMKNVRLCCHKEMTIIES